MRRILAVFMLAAACSIAPTDPSDAGREAGACDGKKSCDACQQCAAQQACAALISACKQNPSCVGLDQCIALCGADLPCKQQCAAGNAGGLQGYEAMMQCILCDQCASDCAGFRTCS
jgi:hypothetical protein